MILPIIDIADARVFKATDLYSIEKAMATVYRAPVGSLIQDDQLSHIGIYSVLGLLEALLQEQYYSGVH